MAVPKFVVFGRSPNSTYLRFVKEQVNHKFLQFSAQRITDPCAKFEVEHTDAGNGQVHIRCCYNNKYLRRESSNSTWLVAAAEKPEEDTSIWSCTLFSIGPGHIPEVNLLTHVQLGQLVGGVVFPGSTGLCLRVTNSGLALVFHDWETLVFLPKHVAFKGDNGKYLSAQLINGQRHLQFSSENIEDPTIRFEVVMGNHGFIDIKSDHFGTFWNTTAGNPRWINVNSTVNAYPFWPIRINNNVIALCTRSRNFFAGRFSSATVTDSLALMDSTIAKTARMEVEEVVLSRRVDSVIYHLMDASIYNERALIVATAEAINKTQAPSQVQLNFSYKEFTSNTWKNEVTVTAGVFAQFRFGIPFLKTATIEVSAEVTADWQWGETRETTTEVESTLDVTVPPMKMVRVRLLATESLFDVPFSYVQRDTLTDGREVIHQAHGGVFTGLNSYNFRYETEEEELPMSSELMQQELQLTKKKIVSRSAL